jgi:hypothetical protein
MVKQLVPEKLAVRRSFFPKKVRHVGRQVGREKVTVGCHGSLRLERPPGLAPPSSWG